MSVFIDATTHGDDLVEFCAQLLSIGKSHGHRANWVDVIHQPSQQPSTFLKKSKLVFEDFLTSNDILGGRWYMWNI